MLPDTHFFVMLPGLLPDDIAVFRDNPHQPVHIFGMVTHQFGELCSWASNRSTRQETLSVSTTCLLTVCRSCGKSPQSDHVS
jgi:hypothetical protein